MIKTGIDLVKVDRIKTVYKRKNFSKYFLTEYEKSVIARETGTDSCTHEEIIPYETIAGLFAAKEAVSKALGVGLSLGWKYNEIEINETDLGEPIVVLSGKMKERFDKIGGKEVSVSISHDAGIAAAVCVILG